MTDAPFDLGQFLTEHAEEPKGQGFVCQMEVEGGWMLVPSPAGLGQNERFFSAVEFGEDAELMAVARAKDYKGVEARVAIQVSLIADSVKGEERNWKGGRRIFQWQPWHTAYTDVFKPSFEEALKQGFKAGRPEWVHVLFKPDPWHEENRPDEDPKWVPYIHEYLVTEENAEAYAESNISREPDPFDIPPQPEEWGDGGGIGSYREYALELGREFIKDPNINPEEQKLDDLGLTVELVKQIRDAALRSDENLPF